MKRAELDAKLNRLMTLNIGPDWRLAARELEFAGITRHKTKSLIAALKKGPEYKMALHWKECVHQLKNYGVYYNPRYISSRNKLTKEFMKPSERKPVLLGEHDGRKIFGFTQGDIKGPLYKVEIGQPGFVEKTFYFKCLALPMLKQVLAVKYADKNVEITLEKK